MFCFCFTLLITLDFDLGVAWETSTSILSLRVCTMVAFESSRAWDFLCQADDVPLCLDLHSVTLLAQTAAMKLRCLSGPVREQE